MSLKKLTGTCAEVGSTCIVTARSGAEYMYYNYSNEEPWLEEQSADENTSQLTYWPPI